MSGACRARRLSSFLGDERRWRERVAGAVLTWLALINLAAVVNAQEQAAVVRVEEDWELVVGEPDSESTAPQVTCTMSPSDNLDGSYASIELNHQTQPDFAPGGVHLQLWEGEDSIETEDAGGDETLSEEGETVCWTQSMSLDGSTLKFEVNGTSTTWGSFGGGELKANLGTSLTSLGGYSPSTSVANSGVGFGYNRVTRLVLKEVRYYSAQGLLSRDTTERAVYPQ